MKQFKCADAGFKECNWSTTGDSEDEIVKKAQQHGQQAHNRTPQGDDLAKLKPLIKTV